VKFRLAEQHIADHRGYTSSKTKVVSELIAEAELRASVPLDLPVIGDASGDGRHETDRRTASNRAVTLNV
jgi:hypothetical protein